MKRQLIHRRRLFYSWVTHLSASFVMILLEMCRNTTVVGLFKLSAGSGLSSVELSSSRELIVESEKINCFNIHVTLVIELIGLRASAL